MSKSESGSRVVGIIVTHGKLAEEILRTSELIYGRVEDCYAICGSEISCGMLDDRIQGIISESAGKHIVLFVDYSGGSCCTSCLRAVREKIGVKVISGVNLPAFLDFVSKRDTMEFDEMVEHVVHRGKDSIRVVEL